MTPEEYRTWRAQVAPRLKAAPEALAILDQAHKDDLNLRSLHDALLALHDLHHRACTSGDCPLTSTTEAKA